MQNYNWACIGAGHIANEMANAFAELGKGFYAVTSKTKEKAVLFAENYNIPNVYDNVDELLDDKNVDVVYIATPHNTHISIIIKALSANKHILCEKAITLNSDELSQAMALAKEKGLVLAEAMTIFHMPVYKELDKLIGSGALGALRQIQVNLGSNKDYDMTNRFFNMSLAGGAMLDIGVYALSFARYFMTSFSGNILSQMKKAPSGADEQVGILLQNDFGEMATVTLSLTAKLPKLAIASFENGYIELDNYNRAFTASVTYNNDGHSEIIKTDACLSALCYEIIDIEKTVSGEADLSYINLTKDVMDVMTRVRYEHEMLYPEEK